MNLKEFTGLCGKHTKKKQELVAAILGFDQATISVWIKSGVVGPYSCQKVSDRSGGLISKWECNSLFDKPNKTQSAKNKGKRIKILVDELPDNVKRKLLT
jgi:hypothetical protein